jgi:hypothetical protein
VNIPLSESRRDPFGRRRRGRRRSSRSFFELDLPPNPLNDVGRKKGKFTMATFKYMIDGKEMAFDSIGNGQVKKQFKDLQAALEARLGSIRCPVHDREPMVILFSKKNELTGIGYNACCKELADKFPPLTELTIPSLDLSKWETTTRIMKYTEMG